MATRAQSITWHTEALPPDTLRALDFMKDQPWLKESSWYLAGGTALALYEGHRQSVDLDFFIREKLFSSAQLVGNFPSNLWKSDIVKDDTVYGRLHGAKVSFIAYPFFTPAIPYQWYGAVPVLTPQDIAVMKIIAISQRGRKRDFIDLYWYLTHHEALQNVLHRVHVQYPLIEHNFDHILKSLVYFTDAEEDPMPTLFFKADWATIKGYFCREVPRVTRELLELPGT